MPLVRARRDRGTIEMVVADFRAMVIGVKADAVAFLSLFPGHHQAIVHALAKVPAADISAAR